ncbi:MAG: slipin family protein [Coriobacteriia bacterium]|nr:slipin family protein [Coriobacteriia bacterium]
MHTGNTAVEGNVMQAQKNGLLPPPAHAKRFSVTPDYHRSPPGELASRTGATMFTIVVFLVAFAAVVGIWWALYSSLNLVALIVALIVALCVSSSVHIVQQWEKVVVLRLGRFSRVAGPGLFFIIPLIESCTIIVDQRIRATPFDAEEALTADLVPLDIDAVLFWMVWDVQLACIEVSDFSHATKFAAQTALRDAIGRANAAAVVIRREQLDRELKAVLAEKVEPWGISILSVEIRDIRVPKELQDVMSLEAQAEQRKKARIALMEAEQDISKMLAEIGETYAQTDIALRLRMMHLLYESVRETGGTVVIPSSFSEGFADILPDDALGELGRLATR